MWVDHHCLPYGLLTCMGINTTITDLRTCLALVQFNEYFPPIGGNRVSNQVITSWLGAPCGAHASISQIIYITQRLKNVGAKGAKTLDIYLF